MKEKQTRKTEILKIKTNYLGMNLFLKTKEVVWVLDKVTSLEKIEYVETKYFFLGIKYKDTISEKL